jgi:predicted transcriptional regulator
MQKSLALTHNFPSARQLKQCAERLQSDEAQRAKERAAEAMKAEYDTIIKRQQKEVETWQSNWARKRMTLDLEKSHELEARSNLKKQLSSRVASARARKMASNVPKPAKAATTGLCSERTRALVIDYREQPEGLMLELEPSQVKKLTRAYVKTPQHASRKGKEKKKV